LIRRAIRDIQITLSQVGSESQDFVRESARFLMTFVEDVLITALRQSPQGMEYVSCGRPFRDPVSYMEMDDDVVMLLARSWFR
jgi:hypothetical protein